MTYEIERIKQLSIFIFNKTGICKNISVDKYTEELAREVSIIRNMKSSKRSSLSNYRKETDKFIKLCADIKNYFEVVSDCDDEARRVLKIKLGSMLRGGLSPANFIEILDELQKGASESYVYVETNKILGSIGRPKGINKRIHGNYDPQKETLLFRMVIREIIGFRGTLSVEIAAEIHAAFVHADLEGFRFDELDGSKNLAELAIF